VNPILIGFVGVLMLPLFVASWRLNLIGLALQGLLMAWILYELDPALDSYTAWLGMVDLALVRGAIAPLALYAVLRSQGPTARHDVIPPNLMVWALAIALLIVAFRFADLLVPVGGNEHGFVAGASAGVLLGLLVLATQTGPFSQMTGALRIENGVAMLELAGDRDPLMQTAQTVILIVTILMFRWYLKTLPRASAVKVSAVEGMNP
jgi:hydrogenase-4 membrane subunit HyfE